MVGVHDLYPGMFPPRIRRSITVLRLFHIIVGRSKINNEKNTTLNLEFFEELDRQELSRFVICCFKDKCSTDLLQHFNLFIFYLFLVSGIKTQHCFSFYFSHILESADSEAKFKKCLASTPTHY